MWRTLICLTPCNQHLLLIFFLKDCPDDCINLDHGKCNKTTGICECTPEYAGDRCELSAKKCPDDCTDEDHGICNKVTGICNCITGFIGEACDEVGGKVELENLYTAIWTPNLSIYLDFRSQIEWFDKKELYW